VTSGPGIGSEAADATTGGDGGPEDAQAFHAEGMVVLTESGERQVIDLRRHGGKVSFAFGAPALRSCVWNAIVRPNGDVYLSERSLAAELKFSLHQSGRWRNAWVNNAGRLTPSGEQWAARHVGDRVLDKWDRPAPYADHYTLAVCIRVGSDEVRPVPGDDVTENKVEFVEPPDAGRLGIFAVLLCRPSPEVFQLTDSLVLRAFAMETGEVALIVAMFADYWPGEKAMVEELRGQTAARWLSDPSKAGVSLSEHGGLFHFPRPDGCRLVWEIGFD
jgi:hypothetical protein